MAKLEDLNFFFLSSKKFPFWLLYHCFYAILLKNHKIAETAW